MTYRYTDPDSHRIETTPGWVADTPAITITTWNAHGDTIRVDIPLDRIEEFIAGARDSARQAANQEQHA